MARIKIVNQVPQEFAVRPQAHAPSKPLSSFEFGVVALQQWSSGRLRSK